jgi:hypothetical protein
LLSEKSEKLPGGLSISDCRANPLHVCLLENQWPVVSEQRPVARMSIYV